ncbi:hypothetical protein TOPH_08823 [Tolypocladium ophioglossoides CBS 100239]|uniref:Uncharacterized protein n=1 Tax=Tolypocladium ophioglossoides (strain CBS 100239) TaxID=1163406 RepID=A0A0L0MXL3_TOLOC|nr:hypothetical protein TOPH_08823 [Tolypocladium ophioglossoides CBS 100239]
MALGLHIPPCVCNPPHIFHPPTLDRPLRIQIEGPLACVRKLLPESQWPSSNTIFPMTFPLPASLELARLVYRTIYGHEARSHVAGDLLMRADGLGWRSKGRQSTPYDYYGVTFDHLVPADDPGPEVLQINIMPTEEDGSEETNKYLLFQVDVTEYAGKRVLAVSRCCQKRKGTSDRRRVNDEVNARDQRSRVSA